MHIVIKDLAPTLTLALLTFAFQLRLRAEMQQSHFECQERLNVNNGCMFAGAAVAASTPLHYPGSFQHQTLAPWWQGHQTARQQEAQEHVQQQQQ
jgi:hypothetical protein